MKKTGTTLSPHKRESDISEQIALKIQRNAYDLSQRNEKDTFTQPYKIIAEQLQVEDEQIFRAAVFNMSTIAINSEKVAEAVIELLSPYVHDNSKTPYQQEYIKDRIAEIKKAHKK